MSNSEILLALSNLGCKRSLLFDSLFLLFSLQKTVIHTPSHTTQYSQLTIFSHSCPLGYDISLYCQREGDGPSHPSHRQRRIFNSQTENLRMDDRYFLGRTGRRFRYMIAIDIEIIRLAESTKVLRHLFN